jgi:hypothetical protein
VELSYCVVNTNGRDELLACLASIERTHPPELEAELLVLDNASEDGSATAARAWASRAGGIGRGLRVIELERRAGKAANDSLLLREAHGDLCLLLNEDSELQAGATLALVEALRADPVAAIAGARLLAPGGAPLASAWRLPGLATALASAVFLHRWLVTESGGDRTREVGWVQSAAMLVRRRAADSVGYLDPRFFVYSDETDFCKRLRDAGWRILHVPGAEAIHHEQLASDRLAEGRRLVEFHRGRDLYMRKHHGPVAAAIVRVLSAWTYLPRAFAALVLPGHEPRRYLFQARLAMTGGRGEGLREAADAFNAQRTAEAG